MRLDGERASFADEGRQVGTDVAMRLGRDGEERLGSESVGDGGGEDLENVQTGGSVRDT